jgi:Recombination endonuclease VII
MMTQDLYTPDDIKKVRQVLLKEQNNKCLLTGIPITMSDSHCDHAHDSEQLVRGALHRHANLTLGKLEGLWLRYLSFWYPHDLPTFLRQAACYLERPKDTRWRHNGWLKKLQTKFNALTTKQRATVLELLGCTVSCSNDTQRKKEFAKLLKDRSLGYNRILAAIESAKS